MISPRLPLPQALIVDLDQTLVDTRAVKTLRSQRAWKQVYARIPNCSLVPGALMFLELMAPVPVAIVTSSPSAYAEKVVSHFKIRYDHLVAYYDSTRHKPYPEPFQIALRKLRLEPRDVWSIGDHPADIIASRAAGIQSTIALKNASDDRAALLGANPSIHVEDWSVLATEVRGWLAAGCADTG